MHLLLTEIHSVVQVSYNAMKLPYFLAMYYVYLNSGLFTETSNPSDNDSPVFLNMGHKTDIKNANSITHDFKSLHESFVNELIFRRQSAL